MAYYLLPSEGKLASIAPSLARRERGVGTSKASMNVANGVHKTPHSHHDVAEVNNPTVIPEYILKQFHFTFLIRHPRSSIPSFYRCTVPPLDQVTGWYNFMPSEAGYEELRQVFDHLRETGQVGPAIAGDRSRDSNIHGHAANGDATTNGSCEKVDICVIDADDLLDNPHGIIELIAGMSVSTMTRKCLNGAAKKITSKRRSHSQSGWAGTMTRWTALLSSRDYM